MTYPPLLLPPPAYRSRAALEAAIARAIETLDAMDGDTDIEDDEREETHDDEDDRTDQEPCLGWSEAYSLTSAVSLWGHPLHLLDGELDAAPVEEVLQ